MKISEKYKEIVIKEFEFVIANMDSSGSFEEKLYFFSGLQSVIHRVLNIEYDSKLVFLHHVLLSVHAAFNGRLNAMKKKAETPLVISDEMINSLMVNAEELYKCIKSDNDIYPILERLVELAYLTTGNGYYLYSKGLIEI